VFKKKRLSGLTPTAPTVLGIVSLGAKYGKVKGFRARNYASSAMAGAGTDTAERLELKDANGNIFFLDAADRDYATAEVVANLAYDDLNTGLGITQMTGIGAAWVAAEGQAIEPPVVQGPITVTIRNCGTATDFFVVDLLVEV